MRRPNFVWGIGLLSVSSAVLLDTILGTFNRDELLADLGIFYYLLSGVIFGGAAAWLWGLVQPLIARSSGSVVAADKVATAQTRPTSPVVATAPAKAVVVPPAPEGYENGYAAAGVDREMLYDAIRTHFTEKDIKDLIFDLDINEFEVVTPGQSMDELVVRVMDKADQKGLAGTVSLAVERILTPPPAEYLPRPEKLTPDSPRTVLRHFLLANYTLAQLEEMSVKLGLDWEQLEAGTKKDKVRSLLLHLYRHNRIEDLLQLLKPEKKQRAKR